MDVQYPVGKGVLTNNIISSTGCLVLVRGLIHQAWFSSSVTDWDDPAIQLWELFLCEWF